MVVVGTSGYYYREWRGSFYPEDLPPRKWLSYYSNYFNGLEINSTFYRPPTTATLKKLSSYPLFYSLKLFKGITHERKLKKEFFLPFFKAKNLLGNKLLTVLAQFPYSFTPKELPFLKELISLFAQEGILLTLELKNPSWKEEIGELPVPVACLSFPDGLNWLKECVRKEELAYYRLHGKNSLYCGSYSEKELKDLALKLCTLPSVFKLVFFNNTKGGAPFNALTLLRLLNESCEDKKEKRDYRDSSSRRSV